MNDRPTHSNGTCLSCGGTVDEQGMALGGEVEDASGEHEMPLDSSGGPSGSASEDMAGANAREFAKSIRNGGR